MELRKTKTKGDIFRLINSRLFRLKHLKRSWNNKTLSKFKIIIGIFLTIRNPESYYEDTTNAFFRFIKLVNSKKFNLSWEKIPILIIKGTCLHGYVYQVFQIKIILLMIKIQIIFL